MEHILGAFSRSLLGFDRLLMNSTRPQLRKVFWTLCALKCGYWLLLLSAVALWPDMSGGHVPHLGSHWPRERDPSFSLFASHFAAWDTGHYLYLSELGYEKGVPSCAFYPLWPLLVRWLSPLAWGSHLLAGLLLANACSLVAWVLFYWLVARYYGEGPAKWSLAFLILFPGSLFFQFHYTESLFLLLVLLLWLGLGQGCRWYVVIAAILLPLTRAVGVFAVLPIAAWVLQPGIPWLKVHLWCLAANNRSEAEVGGDAAAKSVGYRQPAGIQGPILFPFGVVFARTWLLVAPLLGWGIYLLLMWHWTGNPFEGITAQKYWGVHAINNLWNLPKFMIGFFTPTNWHAFKGSVLDRCAFMPILYCLPVLWRLDKRLLLWIYILGILPAMSGTFTSFTRFASCAFPLFIALAVVFQRPERRRMGYGMLGAFGLLHAVLLWRFVHFCWAG